MENEDNIENEQYIPEYPLELNIKDIEEINTQMKKCVCKIYSEKYKVGTGFFLKFNCENGNKIVKALVTNNHIINEKDLNRKITFSLDNQKDLYDIKLVPSRNIFTNSKLDITIIELKNHEFNNFNFLELDDNFDKKKQFLNILYEKTPLYILHYKKGKEVYSSFGILEKIKENDIYHKCCTDNGSSGSPILSLETKKVIGIHKSAEKGRKENIGTLLYDIQNYFFSYSNEMNKKFVYSNNYVKIPNMNNLNFSKNNNKKYTNSFIYRTHDENKSNHTSISNNNINNNNDDDIKTRTDKKKNNIKKNLNIIKRPNHLEKNNYKNNIKIDTNTYISKNNKINYNNIFFHSIKDKNTEKINYDNNNVNSGHLTIINTPKKNNFNNFSLFKLIYIIILCNISFLIFTL